LIAYRRLQFKSVCLAALDEGAGRRASGIRAVQAYRIALQDVSREFSTCGSRDRHVTRIPDHACNSCDREAGEHVDRVVIAEVHAQLALVVRQSSIPLMTGILMAGLPSG
jgi:DNA-binding helix-hairpin-helix protein with protein kinase domain